MAVRSRLEPIALALVVVAAPALAQTASEPQLPEVKVQGGRDAATGYNAPTATTASKIEAPLRDIPQTVNVVPKELLRDQAATSMQDALRNVPGVTFGHGDGQRDQVWIRGFSTISDQFVDGVRDDALYFRDLANVERIEVLKGPASVLYGRGSSGGLINRITKQPEFAPRYELGAVFGSFDQRRVEWDLGDRLAGGAASVRLNGAIERSDSYRSQQFLEREALSPSLALRPASDTRVVLQADTLSDRRVTDFGIPAFNGRPVDVPARTYYGAANARQVDYSQSTVDGGTLKLDHRLNADWSFRDVFRSTSYTLDRNNTLVGSVNETARTASLNRTNLRRQEDGVFNQSEFVQKARFGGIEHQILYGLELGRQTKDQRSASRNNVATVSLFNPVLPVLPLTVNAVPSTDNTGIFNTTGVYVQDFATLAERWKLLAGLRLDRFGQSTVERLAGRAGLRRVDQNWSPRVGLVYQPTLEHSYYASVSRSFQPSGEAFALAANNADIAPEETVNRELGAKIDFFGGLLTATGSLFRLERTNIKVTNPATNTLIPVGTQRTDGLELALAGEFGSGWQAAAGYAYLDGRVVRSIGIDSGQPIQGKRPTLAPGHSSSLWLSKAVGEGWRLGGGLSFVGARFANPGNTVTLPRYTVFDAGVFYRVKGLDVALNVKNLFDRKFIVAGHGSAPNLNLPGAPRSVQVTLRYAF